MNDESNRPDSADEALVGDEEQAAATEAGEIGGEGSDDGSLSEAQRPVAEGGGGESEGFEQAEELLEEHASHGDPGPDPTEMAGEPEDPDARPDAQYGEADDARTVDP